MHVLSGYWSYHTSLPILCASDKRVRLAVQCDSLPWIFGQPHLRCHQEPGAGRIKASGDTEWNIVCSTVTCPYSSSVNSPWWWFYMITTLPTGPRRECPKRIVSNNDGEPMIHSGPNSTLCNLCYLLQPTLRMKVPSPARRPSN
jgi:hypothetical protein